MREIGAGKKHSDVYLWNESRHEWQYTNWLWNSRKILTGLCGHLFCHVAKTAYVIFRNRVQCIVCIVHQRDFFLELISWIFFWIKGLFPILCAIIRRIRLVHVCYSRWFYLSPTRIALKNLKKTLEINYGLSPQCRPTWWIRIFFCHQQLFENSARLIPVGARDIGCGFSPKTRDETQCRWQKKKKRKKKFSYIASVLS